MSEERKSEGSECSADSQNLILHCRISKNERNVSVSLFADGDRVDDRVTCISVEKPEKVFTWALILRPFEAGTFAGTLRNGVRIEFVFGPSSVQTRHGIQFCWERFTKRCGVNDWN
jgi:hypothetical protein